MSDKKRLAAIKRAAENRAAVAALFARSGPLYIASSVQVAKELGIETHFAKKALTSLASNGQLVDAGKRGREYLYRLKGVTADEAKKLVPKSIAVGNGEQTKYPVARTDEVELVVKGITIVAGVNPVSGRIRIIIEG